MNLTQFLDASDVQDHLLTNVLSCRLRLAKPTNLEVVRHPHDDYLLQSGVI